MSVGQARSAERRCVLIRYRLFKRALAIAALLCPWAGLNAQDFNLLLKRTHEPRPVTVQAVHRPELLPQSTVSFGEGLIESAWLANATSRYAHGVLGDALEASRLVIRLRDGREVSHELAQTRVFEDLSLRLQDLDGDGLEEIIVVESDKNLGASLAVYGLLGDTLALRSRAPFIGKPNRWLNPLGVGDLDGDGELEIALVLTPHIGGILQIYRYNEPELSFITSQSGYSTHSLGSVELALGQVVTLPEGDYLLLPNQQKNTLVLLNMQDDLLHPQTQVELPGRMRSALVPMTQNTYWFEIEDGESYVVEIVSPPVQQ